MLSYLTITETTFITVPIFYPAISGDLILASRNGASVHFQMISEIRSALSGIRSNILVVSHVAVGNYYPTIAPFSYTPHFQVVNNPIQAASCHLPGVYLRVINSDSAVSSTLVQQQIHNHWTRETQQDGKY